MNASAAIALALQLIEAAARISSLIRQAQAEGRDSLTDAEKALVLAENDAARERLVAAIAKAK